MANGIYEPGFGRLLQATLYEPNKVKDIVLADRSILEATNRTGENALRWCALELLYDEVLLLSSLGSSIQRDAVLEALYTGNSDMLLLLLELGGDISIEEATSGLKSGIRNSRLKTQTLRTMQSHLGAFGLHVDMSNLKPVLY